MILASFTPATAYTYTVKPVDNSGNGSVAPNRVGPTTAVSFEVFLTSVASPQRATVLPLFMNSTPLSPRWMLLAALLSSALFGQNANSAKATDLAVGNAKKKEFQLLVRR